MKNQIGRGVKVNIFGIFENFYSNNNKENIFGFLFLMKNMDKDGKYTKDVYSTITNTANSY